MPPTVDSTEAREIADRIRAFLVGKAAYSDDIEERRLIACMIHLLEAESSYNYPGR